MSNDLIRDLQSQREELGAQINAMAVRLNDEPDSWTDEDDATFAQLETDYEGTCSRMQVEKRKQKAASMQARLDEDNKRIDANYNRSTVANSRMERQFGRRISPKMRTEAMLAWARPGEARTEWMDSAEACNLSFRQKEVTANVLLHSDHLGAVYAGMPVKAQVHQMMERFRAQQATDPGSAGGFTVPDGMMQAIEVALLQFGVIRGSSTVYRTADGRPIPWPTVNDTGNKGEIIGENAAVNQQDVVFGQIVTKPFKYSSKKVPVSIELMQDSATSMPALLGRLLGERIGRIQADHFTVGTGTGEPTGIVTAAADSTVALGAIDAPTYDNIIDLKHSVDPAYRQVGQGFMFHDSILAAVKKIADSQGMPIWKAGLAENAPDTIDGDPYVINQSMPVGASAKAMLYGQLDKYIIHEAMDYTLIRLDELGAENGQVIFLAWARADGNLLDAGTEPVKYAANPAS